MEWTPEIFASIITGSGIALYGLKRLGILNMDWTRNKNNNTDITITRKQRPECKDNFKMISGQIDTLETDRTEAKTLIETHEKRLDKGEENFKEIMAGIATITTQVGYLHSAEQKRNGDG